MSTIVLFPNRNRVYDIEGTHQVARAAAMDIADSRVKNVKVVTADWSGPVTDYPRAAELDNLPAFKADVKHKMNNPNAYPNHGTGADEFIVAQSLIAKRVDNDTTTVWIFADQAPPYDVVFTFVA